MLEMKASNDDKERKKQRRREIGHLVRQARERIDGMTQTKLSTIVFGIDDHQTVEKIENGKRGTTADELAKIAETLDTTQDKLLGRSTRRRQVSLLGEVGRHGMYYAGARSGRWMEIKKIDAPVGDELVNAAVRIVGNDLVAAGYCDGDTLYFMARGDGSTAALMGKRCIVQLRDSEAFVGIVSAGSKKDHFRVQVLGGDILSDVQIEWAAKVLWHQQG